MPKYIIHAPLLPAWIGNLCKTKPIHQVKLSWMLRHNTVRKQLDFFSFCFILYLPLLLIDTIGFWLVLRRFHAIVNCVHLYCHSVVMSFQRPHANIMPYPVHRHFFLHSTDFKRAKKKTWNLLVRQIAGRKKKCNEKTGNRQTYGKENTSFDVRYLLLVLPLWAVSFFFFLHCDSGFDKQKKDNLD